MAAASNSASGAALGLGSRFESGLEALGSLYRDPAVRYGIKFGLAGILAVFIALLLRLPEPTWALFTVFVLMVAQYVGAIAEKSFFRLIGTIAGGVLGYLLTASLEQQPLLFLTLTGLLVAVCTAMFGQSRFPYAFLLCGLTTVVVVSNGLDKPDASWQYMLVRVEEVTVGILATILVQCLLWPRFARLEFSRNSQAAFADLKNCFAGCAPILLDQGNPEAARHAENFPERISALRALLDFGARESKYFRARLAAYFEITCCLTRIASAIVTLEKPLPSGSFYRSALREETKALHGALEAALGDLGTQESSRASRSARREAVERAFRALEERFIVLRGTPGYSALPPGDALVVGLHLLALDEIRHQVRLAQELLDTLPEDPVDRSKREPEPLVPPMPPPFWIKTGLKSGIALVAALVLDNWLHPPGAAMLVLATWVFTAMNATSPGGGGDRRAFQYAVCTIFMLLLLSLILLAIRPYLSSYAVMNIVLFSWLFAWGCLSFTIRGVSIPMQVSMLSLVGILGLNGQQPISFQAVAGLFFGLAFAAVLSAVIQRLLWPSLPQWEMRDRFLELLRLSRSIVANGLQALPLWQKTRLALVAAEINLRINLLHPPLCPPDEPQRLRNYLTILRRVESQLAVSAGRLAPALPPEQAARGKDLLAQLEAEMKKQIDAHEAAMSAAGKFAGDPAGLSTLIETWKEWTAECREWMIAHNYPVRDAIRILGLAGRYRAAAEDLLMAGAQAARLRLPLYMGDYAL